MNASVHAGFGLLAGTYFHVGANGKESCSDVVAVRPLLPRYAGQSVAKELVLANVTVVIAMNALIDVVMFESLSKLH